MFNHIVGKHCLNLFKLKYYCKVQFEIFLETMYAYLRTIQCIKTIVYKTAHCSVIILKLKCCETWMNDFVIVINWILTISKHPTKFSFVSPQRIPRFMCVLSFFHYQFPGYAYFQHGTKHIMKLIYKTEMIIGLRKYQRNT